MWTYKGFIDFRQEVLQRRHSTFYYFCTIITAGYTGFLNITFFLVLSVVNQRFVTAIESPLSVTVIYDIT